MVLPSDAAKPSATSNDKINGTQSLQHMFSAYKLSVYALQWLLPDTAQDSIIDVPGQHFRCIHFQMPAILHFVAHRGFLRRLQALGYRFFGLYLFLNSLIVLLKILYPRLSSNSESPIFFIILKMCFISFFTFIISVVSLEISIS